MIDKDSVIDKVRQAYATFRTFRCRGTLRRTIETDTRIESEFGMRLGFARPKNMFLEWWSKEARENKRRTVIATEAGFTECSFYDFEWERGDDVEDILASHAGISQGLSSQIPSLLLGLEYYRLFDGIERVERISDQLGDGYLLSGGDSACGRSVRVRAADWVVLGVKERFHIATGRVECESEYTDILVGLEG